MGFFAVVRDFEGTCSFVVDKASPDAYEGDYAVQIVLDGRDGDGNPVRYESELLSPDDDLWDESQEEQDE